MAGAGCVCLEQNKLDLSVGGYTCPRSETGSELNPGGLPPPRLPGLGGCRPPDFLGWVEPVGFLEL